MAEAAAAAAAAAPAAAAAAAAAAAQLYFDEEFHGSHKNNPMQNCADYYSDTADFQVLGRGIAKWFRQSLNGGSR